jgi:ATP-binding cassette, subfamily C (CFTR/MRP), member 1
MAPALTFVVYSVLYLRSPQGAFDPAVAFTSLSIIHLLSSSLQWFVIAVTSILAAIGSFERIEDYVSSETHKDYRIISRSRSNSLCGITNESTPLLSCTHESSHSPSSRKILDHSVIAVHNGSFSYGLETPPILKHIDLFFRAHTLTMIAGPVGSGKSTLLKALLGELRLLAGSVHLTTGSLGYCAQEPWLPNTSIRKAICEETQFESDWYSTVIQCCVLEEDFRQLSEGDSTVVGSKGGSLSGGQRQRISLARALYSRKKLLLLDDVLSGLDRKTEDSIAANVFGKDGLCRKHGLTTILVTHAIQQLPKADNVVILSRSGTILTQGPFNTLDFTTSFFASNTWTSSQSSQNKDSVETMTTPSTNAVFRTVEDPDLSRATGDLTIYAYYAKAVGWLLFFYLIMQATDTFICFLGS